MQTPVDFSNLASIDFLLPLDGVSGSLQPGPSHRRQLSLIQKGKQRLCEILSPLTSESGPTHDSARGLVLVYGEAVDPDEVTAEVTTNPSCFIV